MTASAEEVSPADGQLPGMSTILEFAELEKTQSETVEPRKCSNASDMSVGATSWGNEMYCFSPLFLLNKHLPGVSIGQYALFQMASSILLESSQETEAKSIWHGTLAIPIVLETCQLHWDFLALCRKSWMHLNMLC